MRTARSYNRERRELDGSFTDVRRTSLSLHPEVALRMFLIACQFRLPWGTLINAALRHASGGQPRISLKIPDFRADSRRKGVKPVRIHLFMSEDEDVLLDELASELDAASATRSTRWPGYGVVVESCMVSLFNAIERGTYRPKPWRERFRGGIPVLISYQESEEPSAAAMKALRHAILTIPRRGTYRRWADQVERGWPGNIPGPALKAIRSWDASPLSEWAEDE